jgi:lipopolysaccharide transport system ATP-binding protein
MLLDHGQLVDYGTASKVVDRYVSSTAERGGEHLWDASAPSSGVRPVALRLRNSQGTVADHILSTETCSVEIDYEITQTVVDFRVGLTISTHQGETLFQSMDTDDPKLFETFSTRSPGRYMSICRLPADLLNAGSFTVGVFASSFAIKSFLREEHVISFTVDASAGVGSRWPETRDGPYRPALGWSIEH